MASLSRTVPLYSHVNLIDRQVRLIGGLLVGGKLIEFGRLRNGLFAFRPHPAYIWTTDLDILCQVAQVERAAFVSTFKSFTKGMPECQKRR